MRWVRNWNTFWFEAEGQSRMRLLQIALGFHFFIAYGIRAMDWKFWYSESGFAGISAMKATLPLEYRESLSFYFTSDRAQIFLTALMLVAFLGMAFGRWARGFSIIAFILHVSFLHRNMAIVYGMDMIGTFFLFYLCFAQTTPGSKRVSPSSWSSMITSAALRFAQLELCIIYAFSGMEKLKGPSWWRGEALWTVWANAHIARFDWTWTANFPLLILLATFITLLWEIYFPALVWFKRWRPWILGMGVLIHTGIGLTVFIPHFAVVMILCYSVFLTENEAATCLKTLQKWVPGLRIY